MATRILVPLGWREPSEAILPFVADIATRAGAIVRLLAAQPIPRDLVAEDGRIVASADTQMTRLEAKALDRLDGARVLLPGVHVERVVRFGDPVAEILLEAQVWAAELIALSERPRPWWTRVLRPGLADRVRRRAAIPVLLYRPLPSGTRPPRHRAPVTAPAT